LAAARRAAARKPQLNYDREIEALESEIDNPTSQPAEASISMDSPFYLKWKGFPSGSKATYIWRRLQLPKGESGDPMPGRTEVRSTYSLQAINSEHADTWFSEVVYDYPSGNAHPPHETEFDYPAKDRNPANAKSAYPTFRSGNQTLVIGGRSLRTHWESVQPQPAACPDFLVTTWTSAEVPGELVRKVNDLNCRGDRRVDETLLESIQGSRSPAALAEAEKRVNSPAGVEANSSSPPPFSMALAPGQGTVPGRQPLPQSMPAPRASANGNAAPTPVLAAQPQTGTVPFAQPSHGVTVPQGTLLYVRLAGMVNSSINTQGSPLSGSLDQPLMVNGVQVAPRGAPVTAQLADLPNGAGLTLRLTDITIAGRKYSLSTSQVAASTTRTAQNNAAETALDRIFNIGGPAADAQARRAAAAREQEQRASQARQVLLNGPRINVPPMTQLVFTLAGEFVF